jgi:hypothetical protein
MIEIGAGFTLCVHIADGKAAETIRGERSGV